MVCSFVVLESYDMVCRGRETGRRPLRRDEDRRVQPPSGEYHEMCSETNSACFYHL